MNLRIGYHSSENIIPAEAGIQPDPSGFRIKHGMVRTEDTIFMLRGADYKTG